MSEKLHSWDLINMGDLNKEDTDRQSDVDGEHPYGPNPDKELQATKECLEQEK